MFTEYYLRYFGAMYNKNIVGINPAAKKLFMEYPWPGNVRELQNTVESMVVSLKDGNMATEEEIPPYILDRMKKQQGVMDADETKEMFKLLSDCEEADRNLEETEEIKYYEIMEATEKKLIERALKKARGNVKEAGRILGMPRETLRYRIKKLGLHVNEPFT